MSRTPDVARRPARRRTATLAAAAGSAVIAVLAHADVDVTARNADRVAGTLDPAGEVETFRYDVPSGAVISVKAQGKKPRRGVAPGVTFRVRDPDGAEIAALQPIVRSGAKLGGLVAAKSGFHAVEVSGDGATTGDYSLSVQWKSPRRLPLGGTLAAGGTVEVTIPVDAGACYVFYGSATGFPGGTSPAAADVVIFGSAGEKLGATDN